MKIITTHLHADFDCIASMVAAKKLYPEAELVFPGSQEKNVRDFLSQTRFPLEFKKLKGLPLDEINQVIIVDASTRERVGVFSELMEKEGVEFHLYDHHPSKNVDIPSKLAVIRQRGATVTIFAEILRDKGIAITPDEATIMALGLYEDTGSLTFTSTCPEDFDAAAWFLTQGADLNTVSHFMKMELNAAQIEILDKLLKSLEYKKMGITQVAMVTADAKRYVGDISYITHKIMDIENPDALFVLVRMEDRVSLVARSRVEGLDVGVVAESFGGGGHPAAASATIKNLTLPQAQDKLWEVINRVVEPAPVAADMMMTSVVTIEADDPISEAEIGMTRYDISGIPVLKEGKVVGLITRQIVEKAIHHGMGSHNVSEFMISEFATVNPDTKAYVVEEIALERRQKQTPVVTKDGGELVGLITRGMILQKLYKDSLLKKGRGARLGHHRKDPVTKPMSRLMQDRLPKKALKLFNVIGDVANKNGYTSYICGGFVRDLLTRAPNMDMDIVIEGDGIDFARKLADRLNGRAKVHEKFKTAVVVTPDGMKIDVATARIEYYSHPAALPTVEMSVMRHDLYRRDFSINAMAISLNGAKPYTLLDYFNGQADLKSRSLRVLHNLSFVEDPTRAFRAVRFESRFGFTLGSQTLSLLNSAVKRGLFNRLSSSRLFTELKLILKERRPAIAFKRMDELGLLKFIHPQFSLDEAAQNLMERCEDILVWRKLAFPEKGVEEWIVHLMAVLNSLSDSAVKEMIDIYPSQKKIIEDVLRSRSFAAHAIKELSRGVDRFSPSRIYFMFHERSEETLLFLAAKARDEKIRDAVTRFLSEPMSVEPIINGSDLKRLGTPPNKTMRIILGKILEAQLDGKVKTKEDALKLAKNILKKERR